MEKAKSKVFWNSLGTVISALTTPVLLSMVKRVCGLDVGDDFSIAFTEAQTLLTVGLFEIRPFQVTDASHKYTFSDYLTLRFVTSAMMMLACLGYLFITGKELSAWALVISLTLYKAVEAIGDIFEGEYQRADRIDLSGKALSVRALLGDAAFIVTIVITKSVLTASLVMMAASALTTIFYCPVLRRSYTSDPWGINLKGKWTGIFKECLILAISSFLYAYMSASSKFAVDTYNSDYNYIYYVLFLPSYVINLMSTMCFKLVITHMTEMYEKKKYKAYMNYVYVLLFVVVLLTVICVLAAWLLGIPVLSVIFDINLKPYLSVLLILIAGGGLNAAGILMYYAILVMRMSRGIFVSYVIAFVCSLILPFIMTKSLSITGAAWSYDIVMGVLFMLFMALFIYRGRKDMKNEG